MLLLQAAGSVLKPSFFTAGRGERREIIKNSAASAVQPGTFSAAS